MDQKYFAALPAEELAPQLSKKVESYANEIETSKLRARWQKQWRYYYNHYFPDSVSGLNSTGADIKSLGDQGELSAISVNHFRNLIQHLLVFTTSNRPAMEVRATNSDSKSMVQARIGNILLDYYMREKRLEAYLYRAVEQALVFGSGYIRIDWDVNSGKEYGVDPQSNVMRMEGDLKFSNPSIHDLVFDTFKEDWADNSWIIQRSFRNKFDLAAMYPEVAEKILAVPSKNEKADISKPVSGSTDTDDIEIFEFFHKKTPTMPNGRYMLFVSPNIVLLDSKLPYRDIPIYRIVPAEILGTQYGYSPAFDLSGCQEALNLVFSTILTNISTFGVQNIAVPKNSDITVQALAGGLNLLEYDANYDAPKALELLKTPPEVYKFAEIMEHQMETLSGVNSVARGNPEASLKSGTALALIQSTAIQFASGLQNSYARLIEDVGTGSLRILRDYASTKRVIMVAGKANHFDKLEFTGDDLENINRVIVDVGNPLTRTTSGRVELATNMINAGLPISPEQYMNVVTTGQLEPLTKGLTNELHTVQCENESLVDGKKPVLAVTTDDHVLHIKQHKAVIANPDARQDAGLVERTLAHIQEHINQMRMVDPALLAVLGYQSLQAPPPPPGTPGAPPPPDMGPSGNPLPPPSPQQGPNPRSAQMPKPAQPPSSVGGPNVA